MDIQKQISSAVKEFWRTRASQKEKQSTAGRSDQGLRGPVTGGAQLDGFVKVVSGVLAKIGLPGVAIIKKKNVVLPGFFRPTREWDLLVIVEGRLVATIEFKSQIGPSFGNNFNNRTEEALGSALDLWTAYREGVFSPSSKPWLGYFMLLEECEKSISPVNIREPHFNVLQEFHGSSYSDRYRLFCEKLVRERLYDSACFIMSNRVDGKKGIYSEPSAELGVANFINSLTAQALVASRLLQ